MKPQTAIKKKKPETATDDETNVYRSQLFPLNCYEIVDCKNVET